MGRVDDRQDRRAKLVVDRVALRLDSNDVCCLCQIKKQERRVRRARRESTAAGTWLCSLPSWDGRAPWRPTVGVLALHHHSEVRPHVDAVRHVLELVGPADERARIVRFSFGRAENCAQHMRLDEGRWEPSRTRRCGTALRGRAVCDGGAGPCSSCKRSHSQPSCRRKLRC